MAPDPVAAETPAQGLTPRYFTWDEVAQRSGCKERWLVIDRKVYNVSEFTRRHPGGSRVISHYAGQDATVSAARLGHGRGRGRRLSAGETKLRTLRRTPTNSEESPEAPEHTCGPVGGLEDAEGTALAGEGERRLVHRSEDPRSSPRISGEATEPQASEVVSYSAERTAVYTPGL
ncbi:hypothetical protein P7K49_021704 [Saguinus oedipus]|uniref:Cytochrome b5 heme-binding domain-containing protein n=1 Tax=Saguinus oedipus TaxID=9490 RepID=A0ABQ9UU60_SAGOE|nr:hypothetical protein P7K49_021704 [Saguinus oedipus]